MSLAEKRVNEEFQKLLIEKRKVMETAPVEDMTSAMNDLYIVQALLGYIGEKAKKDLCYDSKVMTPELTLGELLNFLNGKAKEFELDGVAMVPDEVVYSWVDDFYQGEGIEMIRKREAEQEKRKKEAAEAKKAADAKKTSKAKKTAEEKKDDASPIPTEKVKDKTEPSPIPAEKVENKTGLGEMKETVQVKKENDGQLSFF